MECSIQSGSAAESFAIARRIGSALPTPAVVLLDGPMGAGKTVFAKGLHLGAGGTDERLVTSPSYNLVNRYDDGPRPCYHVDLYRLEDER
ncbi:MAG: tRNA (adenosine(37)-N6)-threonylcarbamoyltransferase complex ATPase subunit type 1 TsaE, partial [Planctomycetes bacterium]|nr:tRNA (adenosine(37)-N6)-threonylcarbamoyltransferase complex ATPase subunit type 1 TsaE [Planctomycetota bacterium]